MALIDKETIRAELERYKQGAAIARFDNAGENADYFQGKVDLCDDLTHILDTLPEQPVEDLNELIRKWDRVNINTIQKAKVKATGEIIDGFYDGRGHFDHFVDHDIFDRYSVEDVEPIIDEQPVEGLEEEIDRLWESFSEEMSGPHNLFDMYRRLARHFAQWGAEHAKK